MFKENFWTESQSGLFALAPMEDVTDTVFRELVMSVSLPSKLHLLFTEFTSVDGLCHPVGREAVTHRLFVNETERGYLNKLNVKLVAQLWGNDPGKFYEASQYISEEFHFDGIDINMGCPVDKVVKQNSCSALISQPDLALEIIDATIRGSGLPVSVKTRTGIKDHQTAKWIEELLRSDLSAITLHARTQKMQSLFPAEWEQVKIAVAVKEEIKPEVRLLGNGDVFSWQNGKELMLQSGADGVMVGRGIFTNPWFFAENDSERDVHAKIGLLENHIRLFTNTWESKRNFSILKRFFKIYVNGFSGASSFRASLMETHQAQDALQVIREFRENHLPQTGK